MKMPKKPVDNQILMLLVKVEDEYLAESKFMTVYGKMDIYMMAEI